MKSFAVLTGISLMNSSCLIGGGVQGSSQSVIQSVPASFCEALLFEVHDFPLILEGQGIQVIGDKIYLYGTAGSGTIQELNMNLEPTGWVGSFSTTSSSTIIPHANGFAYKEGYPVVVSSVQNGKGSTFYIIDWELFYQDRHLDQALLREVQDSPLPVGGHAEYVDVNGSTYLATSDYVQKGVAQIRLLDPQALFTASTRDDPGVVVARFDTTPFVQDMVWSSSTGRLTLVQNVDPFLGWKLSSLNLEKALELGSGFGKAIDDEVCFTEESELEGYAKLEDGRELFLNADVGDNLFLVKPILAQ